MEEHKQWCDHRRIFLAWRSALVLALRARTCIALAPLIRLFCRLGNTGAIRGGFEPVVGPSQYFLDPNTTKRIIFNQTKPVFILTLIKSFSCQSFWQNYFWCEIKWVVLKDPPRDGVHFFTRQERDVIYPGRILESRDDILDVYI